MGPEFAPPPRSPHEPSATGPYPPFAPEPPRPRRLTRSRRERLWAGVAGGMGEYFDLDPNLVRLVWVAATILSHGVGVAVYILLWIILPRDESRSENPAPDWRDWSHDFHTETQRLAQEARRVADDMRGAHPWRAPGSNQPMAPTPPYHDPSSDTGAPVSFTQPSEPAWWADTPRSVEPQHHYGRHPRSTGIVLVAVGVVLLAANTGVFSWINWSTVWPLILIGVGVLLLARRSGWGR